MRAYPVLRDRTVGLSIVLLALGAAPARAQRAPQEFSQASSPRDVLVLLADPDALPAEPDEGGRVPLAVQWYGDSGELQAISGLRDGCADVGETVYAYARDTGNDWVYLPRNTVLADDLTLLPGNWIIECYDVLIYARNGVACNQSRTVTLRAYDACNGAVIPGSQESWTVPAFGGPVRLTGVTNVHFNASGTIWFGMTTTSNNCDGWYIGQAQVAGSTANIAQLGTSCTECINAPSCSPWAGFMVILYGCKEPTISQHPQSATICSGGFHQFCVNVQSTSTAQYQWQRDNVDISGATQACYVASQAGSYRCIVTDDCSSVTSNAATLTVRTGPQVVAPAGGTACAGNDLSMCVSADGIGTLHYQWKRGGLSILGATTSCYYASAAGAYSCLVTDDCGATTSASIPVAYAAPAQADFDGNGVTDLADWHILQGCLAGPATAGPAGCVCVDTDADADIDLADFQTLQERIGN